MVSNELLAYLEAEFILPVCLGSKAENINNWSQVEKQEHTKAKARRRKETINIRAKFNELDNESTIEKTSEPKLCERSTKL